MKHIHTHSIVQYTQLSSTIQVSVHVCVCVCVRARTDIYSDISSLHSIYMYMLYYTVMCSHPTVWWWLLGAGVAVDDVETVESELMAMQHNVQKYVFKKYMCLTTCYSSLQMYMYAHSLLLSLSPSTPLSPSSISLPLPFSLTPSHTPLSRINLLESELAVLDSWQVKRDYRK